MTYLENTIASQSQGVRQKTREVLTEGEVSEWLGLSQPTLSRLRRYGGGPAFVRLSARCIGYRRGAVQTWLDERERAKVV